MTRARGNDILYLEEEAVASCVRISDQVDARRKQSGKGNKSGCKSKEGRLGILEAGPPSVRGRTSNALFPK